MHPKLLDLLACPHCHGRLDCHTTATAADGNVSAGDLRCTGCDRTYPIVRGIPRFVASENYASSFGYQWNRFRQEQIDSINGTRLSERRFRTETGWQPEWLKGKWILDAGCGAGRFLDVASRAAECEIVGVDISTAVDAARETLSDRPNVHFVQASIFELPFRSCYFDGVYCLGVIQHTPDPSRAIRSLATMIRPAGRIAMTIYERRRPWTIFYSRYWLRPFTRRLRADRLLRLIKVLMPPVFVLTEVLFRIPVLKRGFRFVIPVANYVDVPELSLRQRYQWALMDTFDMLAPAYDFPQHEGDVVRNLVESGVGEIRRLPTAALTLVGIKTSLRGAEPIRLEGV